MKIIIRSSIFAILFLLFTISCNKADRLTYEVNLFPNKIDVSSQTTNKAKQINTFKKLLIGKWKSVDDSKFTIEVTADKYIELYSGSSPTSLHYSIAASCNCDGNKQKDNNDTIFLSTYEETPTDCYCYSIVDLDSKKLTLTYLGRGNTLHFERL